MELDQFRQKTNQYAFSNSSKAQTNFMLNEPGVSLRFALCHQCVLVQRLTQYITFASMNFII